MVYLSEKIRPGNGLSCLVNRVAALSISIILIAAAATANAETQTAKIAVPLSVTGAGETIGSPELEGIRLAVDEANATGGGPTIELSVYDDTSNIELGKKLARQIGAGDALVVVGPGTSIMAVETGQIYSDAGMVNIGVSTAATEVTIAPNFFRARSSTSDMAEMLAIYLRYVLSGTRAVVLFQDNAFGRSGADGFRRAALKLGTEAEYHDFKNPAEAEEVARRAAADPAAPAIIVFGFDKATVPVVTTLRRQAVRGPVLGVDTMAGEAYSALFADQPEERRNPGFFTNGIYVVTPLMFDSASAETIAFADRYRARFGREPALWSALGYEGARLAVAAVRATSDAPDLKARRSAIRTWLLSLDGPSHAVPGLNGPLWFTPERSREQALRIGRFQNGIFTSAPAQLVPVRNPDRADIVSGAVIEVGPSRFLRRQQIVYTGVYLNEISRIDITQSTFTADFYLWMRFAKAAGVADADPADIKFASMVRGSFDPKLPSSQGDLEDGTTYRLWQVSGDFKNDFDLHHYPLDRQTLLLRLFNARAASDRIVYVQDRQSSTTPSWVPAVTAKATIDRGISAPASAAAKPFLNTFGSPVALDAFRNLTLWVPIRAAEGRDNLVTESALGDPRLVGLERVRELSGFHLAIEMRRRTGATLGKTILPLGLMALIIYAAMHFPVVLVTQKVAVIVTGVLTGAVLLTSINSQLGNIGYVIAIEYGFYAFFTLCLTSITAVVFAERLRVARPQFAAKMEAAGRHILLLGLFGTVAAGIVAYTQW